MPQSSPCLVHLSSVGKGSAKNSYKAFQTATDKREVSLRSLCLSGGTRINIPMLPVPSSFLLYMISSYRNSHHKSFVMFYSCSRTTIFVIWSNLWQQIKNLILQTEMETPVLFVPIFTGELWADWVWLSDSVLFNKILLITDDQEDKKSCIDDLYKVTGAEIVKRCCSNTAP